MTEDLSLNLGAYPGCSSSSGQGWAMGLAVGCHLSGHAAGHVDSMALSVYEGAWTGRHLGISLYCWVRALAWSGGFHKGFVGHPGLGGGHNATGVCGDIWGWVLGGGPGWGLWGSSGVFKSMLDVLFFISGMSLHPQGLCIVSLGSLLSCPGLYVSPSHLGMHSSHVLSPVYSS